MKKTFFLLLALFLALTFTNCGENQIDKPKDLIKYSVLKEGISDTPIKVQISSDILIEEKDSITEEKLKSLLNYLYQVKINQTGFDYGENPNTIAIYAYTSKSKAESGNGLWIAMISKMYDDKNPKFDLNETQFKSLKEIKENKWNLTYNQRKEIWKKIILAERKAQKDADIKYSLTGSNVTQEVIENNVTYMRKQKEKYEKEIMSESKITEEILEKIGIEGITNGWEFPKK
ncbi:MAG: hypothetical protein R3342_13475 [Lutibacter sp.]|uniref:hypothetical protein n=1 Tax=Lutibacter sp. TaxID=1925666 RepID=UPI00299F487B|nr:hypothetical protein [Lutibacter sp.]MDX1830545.1 hypothetical protein [Lutibacter sp.]